MLRRQDVLVRAVGFSRAARRPPVAADATRALGALLPGDDDDRVKPTERRPPPPATTDGPTTLPFPHTDACPRTKLQQQKNKTKRSCDFLTGPSCGAATQSSVDALAARLDAKIAELEAADAANRAAQARLNDVLTSYRSTVVTVDISGGVVSCTRRDGDWPQPYCLLDALTGTLDFQIDCPTGYLYAGQVICQSNPSLPAWPLTVVGSILNTAYCSLIPPSSPPPDGNAVAQLTVGCQYDARLGSAATGRGGDLSRTAVHRTVEG